MELLFKKNLEEVTLPTYGSEEAAGMDIYAPEGFTLKAGERKMIPLGFSTDFPADHVALVVPRSSSGTKKGIRLTNTVGVIDSDYRGQWHAPVTSDIGCEIEEGERFLQTIFVPIARAVEAGVVDKLPETIRGEGGFGSTGTK